MSTALAPLPPSDAAPLDGAALVRLWLARAHQRSGSDATLRAYTAAASRWARHLGRDVLTATQREALWYAQALAASGLAPASVARDVAALRSLYRLAEELGVLPRSPFAPVRAPRVDAAGAPRMVQREELRAMLEAAAPRGRALLLLLATTGLRISEALGATWDETFADPHGNTGLRVVGKGGKARTVKLVAAVVAALAPWRTEGGPLWPARHGGHATQQAADRMIARIAARAGVRHVSAHWLRHHAATYAYAAGAPLPQVQRDLGHASLATTQRYLHAAEGLRRTSADYVAEGL